MLLSSVPLANGDQGYPCEARSIICLQFGDFAPMWLALGANYGKTKE
jgi:hypothetical protein